MRVLKFSQPNCEPCNVLTSQIEGLGYTNVDYESDDLPVKLKGIYEVNVFDHMDLGMKYNVRKTPTLIAENLFGEKKMELHGSPASQNELYLFLQEAEDEYKR